VKILNFIINEIFGQGAIFLAVIAMIGLLLQKKSFSEVVRGTLMTAIGFFVLNQGTGIITGKSIDGLATAFNTIMPTANGKPDIDMSQFGTEIGIVMIIAFAVNLIFARYSKVEISLPDRSYALLVPLCFHCCRCQCRIDWNQIDYLGGYYHFDLYDRCSQPHETACEGSTGDDSFTIGHPTTTLSLISGYLGKRLVINRNQLSH
jgi:PTS system ascorbate-specific IIC component